MKKLTLKALLLAFIGFWYFFANGLLVKILYWHWNASTADNIENRLHLYWMIGGQQRNLIDLNLPHLIAFVFMGMVFGRWAFVFAVLGELVQVVIRGREFSWWDVGLNILGAMIGIFIIFIMRDFKRGKQ